MTEITTILFDFDGVVVNTEPQYDIFWNAISEKYAMGIDNLASLVRGTTMDSVMEKYLSGLPLQKQNDIIQETVDFEKRLEYIPVPGVLSFIKQVKELYKIGLVTSSSDVKIKNAFEQLDLYGTFDTVVTADRITRGKPDPMCYLLAADDLKALPENCMVFEDAFSGIEAANAAKMRVIGVSTSNSPETLKELVYAVIPDFINSKKIMALLE